MKTAGSMLIGIAILMGVCVTIEFIQDGPSYFWREYVCVIAVDAVILVLGIAAWRHKPQSWFW